VRSSVSFHPVRTMDEVLQLALEQREGGGTREEAAVQSPRMITH
jgi:hypothetical protein